MSVQIGVINAVGPIGRPQNTFPFGLAQIPPHLRRSVSRQPAGAASHKWHYRSPRFAARITVGSANSLAAGRFPRITRESHGVERKDSPEPVWLRW
jgi:hypothetical protein